MIKRIIALVIVISFGYIFYLTANHWHQESGLTGVSKEYVTREANEIGAMNIVTAIVVTYRGLDTLGEVSVLLLAASGVALLLRRRYKDKIEDDSEKEKRAASEFIHTGTRLLTPLIIMFGAYIFLNGHLSPGGGFQGGAVIASAILLLFLTFPDYRLKHGILNIIESFSGFGYVLVGLLGIYFAGGFLDNRFLPLGSFGHILSAGAIPIIYILIGLKVGIELAEILENLKGREA